MEIVFKITLEIILLIAAFGVAVVLRITDGLPKAVSVPGYFVALSFMLAFLSIFFHLNTLNASILLLGGFTALTAGAWVYLVMQKPMSQEKRSLLETRLLFWMIPAIMLIIALLFFERQPTTKYLNHDVSTGYMTWTKKQ